MENRGAWSFVMSKSPQRLAARSRRRVGFRLGLSLEVCQSSLYMLPHCDNKNTWLWLVVDDGLVVDGGFGGRCRRNLVVDGGLVVWWHRSAGLCQLLAVCSAATCGFPVLLDRGIQDILVFTTLVEHKIPMNLGYCRTYHPSRASNPRALRKL